MPASYTNVTFINHIKKTEKTKYWFELIDVYFPNKCQLSKALKIISQSTKSKKKLTVNGQSFVDPTLRPPYSLLKELLFHEFSHE